MSGRALALVLGDQLTPDIAALSDLDPGRDVVWMAEAPGEIERVPTHKTRIVLFLSAMRHFRDELRGAGWTVHYHEAGADDDGSPAFSTLLERAVRELEPDRLVVTRPGSWRVLHELRSAAGRLGLALEVREDSRFLCTLEDFGDWAEGRSRLVLEDFYREMRRRHRVLVEDDDEPAGGSWNFDEENRESFGADGPPPLEPPPSFEPDETTRAVMELVEARWSDHPGSLDGFDLPVTRDQATSALGHFLEHRLEPFGTWQDAMWPGEPFLAHSRLSAALNLGLLDPKACVRGAERRHREDGVRLASVEGFVRQILGWREFVRGVYWTRMPEYARSNYLGAERDVPSFLWNGETDMACVADAMAGVLQHAYAHHIQRLMVLGLFCLLYGTDPADFNDWHVAMYADAVDWASAPNTIGMSQFADGGVVGTKPYCASGRYIDRMGPYCEECRYDPGAATGEDACPFTTLYWDFLARHEELLRGNHRMGFQYANLDRKEGDEMREVRAAADRLKERIAAGDRI